MTSLVSILSPDGNAALTFTSVVGFFGFGLVSCSYLLLLHFFLGQPALSWLSRSLSLPSWLFALVFGWLGAAPLLNNALYSRNKIFLSWVLIDFQSDNQWLYPIFFWGIASGFLLFGIILRRRTANSRSIQFNQAETTRKTWMHSPAIRILLRISALGAYLVFIGYICLLAIGSQAFNPGGTVYDESFSYQGHVYLLSVAPIGGGFNFEVSQCDASGWFCHVIYDRSRNVRVRVNVDSVPPFMYAQLVDAHLQADAPHQQLFILYHGEGTSDSGKLLCPIPSP